MIVSFDIDNTLTLSPLHIGGNSRWGLAVWNGLVRVGWGEKIARRAKARPEAVALVKELLVQGVEVHLISARETSLSQATGEWLYENGLGDLLGVIGEDGGTITKEPHVHLRPAHVLDVGGWKADVVEEIGSRLHVEDDLEVLERMDACGTEALLMHATSWEIEQRLVRALVREVVRA